MSEKSHLQFTKETVIKTGNPSLMRIEIEKTQRAGQIGKDCGMFRVPRVLDFDGIRGVAIFERIEGIEPIYRAVAWGREYRSLGDRIGSSLAVIHQNLTLPSDMIVPLPPDFTNIGQDVFLHGDLSVKNICLDRKSSSIVILDWQMTPVHGGQATYGCRYFDILWFVNNLLWVPTIRHLFSDPVAPVAKIFVESYYRQANIAYNAEDIGRYAENFFSAKLPLRRRTSRSRRFFIPRCNVLTQRFIQSLKMISPNE